MPSFIDPHKLTPNPANTIFDPLPDDVYQALQADIAERGLLNPILATSDFIVIAGHHRLKAALALGLETVPVEIQDVDSQEAESRLIADNVLRRQLNPMEQARLIKRLKEQYGVRPGPKSKRQGTSNTEIISEIALDMTDRQMRNLDKLNDLIPELQVLVSKGKLGTSHGTALATMTTKDQQALWDVIGESVTDLKVSDIQAAKKAPDTSALEAQMAALTAERGELQRQLAAQTATPAPDDESSSLVESLTLQLDAAEATRQEYADALARLKAQGPVERIVEKVVTVEKAVPDEAQAQRIAQLEADLAATQKKVEDLYQSGYKQADLANLQAERKAAEKRLEELRHAMARAVAPDGKADQVRMYRATVVKFIEDVQKKLKPIAGEWQQVGSQEPQPANWMLYLDIQRTADTLESIATGLRRIPLDAAASRKHGMDGTVIIDATATATKGEEDGDTDINAELAD